MGKILRREQYNNGYGCSCCRRDWKKTDWIDEADVIDFETLLTETIKKLDQNCDGGGLVGIVYEKDGEVLYGINANIYRAGWEFYAVFGDDKELLIKDYEGVSHYRSYSVEEILKEFGREDKNDEENL